MLAALDDMLLRAGEQLAESGKYSGLSNETKVGVAARKARDNDPQVGRGGRRAAWCVADSAGQCGCCLVFLRRLSRTCDV